MGNRDFKWHLFLKYHSDLQWYIQIEVNFLDISSLGVTYWYIIEIEQKFKQRNKQEFRLGNLSKKCLENVALTHRIMEKRMKSKLKTSSPSGKKGKTINPSYMKGRVMGSVTPPTHFCHLKILEYYSFDLISKVCYEHGVTTIYFFDVFKFWNKFHHHIQLIMRFLMI